MRTIILITLLLGAGSFATAQNLISVEVTTDQYGAETIWQINPMPFGPSVANGGGYDDFDQPGTYTQWSETVDLPNGNFNFCMNSGVDGLCCGYGYGWITLRHVASGTVLFQSDSTFTGDYAICAQFTVPLGRVQGTLFLDDDHSCGPDSAESRVPSQVLRVLPGPIYGLTDATGDYDIRVPYGDFTIDVVSNGLVPICPATEPVPFSTSAGSPVAQIHLGDSSVTKLDIVAAAVIGPARPGFAVTHTIQFTNASTFVSGPLTATAQLDPLITYTDASIAPSSVVGGMLTWSLPALAGYTQHTIQVHGQLPADPLLSGQEISLVVSTGQNLDESVLWNNAYTAHAVITASFDPNDKQVWPRDLYDLAVDSVLDYTIRFQNTGTDTAFTVVITDTLAAELDMGTFQAGASTHPCTIAFKPGRVVEWRFADILLPDSNVNEPASHGQFGFRISPLQPLLPGTELHNNADIFFDFNPPVRTNDAAVLADFNTGMGTRDGYGLSLSPNPATDVLNVRIPGGVDRSCLVMTADGRTVPVTIRVTDQGLQLDVRSLAPGFYVLRTRSGTARFVKH